MRFQIALRSLMMLAALVVIGSGCSRVATQSAGAGNSWTQPGVLRFAENADPKGLNPMLATSAVVGDLSMFIFSYAVRYNDKSQPVPDAVSEIPTVANGDVSKDGLTLKYKLRHNITFQDGVPLTCKDLKFTWQAVMNPHNNSNTTDGYRDIKSIDCSDPYVAVIHMKKLYAPYLGQLWGVNGNAPILPEHLLAKYNDDKGSFNNTPYNALPIGSGPFRVVEWNRGSGVRMEAYPKYFMGKPKLNEVDFKIYPDENTMITQLQTHAIDMAARGSGGLWPQYERLGADPKNGLTALRLDSFVYNHIDFDLRHPIMNDRQVRLALAYATNRAAIITDLLHGSAIPAETDQSPTLSWAYTNDIQHHPFDQAKARQILDADGWKVGPDGIRVKNGQRLSFNISTQTESTTGKAIQTLVQNEWRQVGVDGIVKNAPTSSFFDNTAAGILQGGHYDVALFAWSAASDPDDSPIYSADNFAPKGQNAIFWDNKTATAAMNDALQTLDQNRRKGDYKIVQQQMAIDVPTIILYFSRTPFTYNTDLQGFKPSPVISPFWNPQEYSI
ncbi:MAG: peptide ABC transporter substrate-binding protein [Candidatus Eremiobacteraeota bacterium]|nr:peptide ABC transporter substrate-binding protein [Candidatus Eremiobacteraeota bacterium]